MWRLPHDVDSHPPPPPSLFVNEEESRTRRWETARRVLQAAAVEANGMPGAYVTQEGVMQRANMVDAEHFRTIARYLQEQGWIDDADADYGVFMVTGTGIAEANQVTLSSFWRWPSWRVGVSPRRFESFPLRSYIPARSNHSTF